MSALEAQTEEREALQSIYEGDENFKEVDATTFQYKYGEENHYKSFLVELKWGDNYPEEAPAVNMNTFYNRHLLPAVKEQILKVVCNEASLWLGCGMTYSLFECLKDNIDQLTEGQTESAPVVALVDEGVGALKISDADADAKKKEPKKEQMTKSQKRRQWERTDHKGDRVRGWDWVDLVKHLSQTGSKEDSAAAAESAAATAAAAPVLHPLNN
ncbi:RWD domain-containing protein 4 [Drosophila madeirensis]|uniref:Blast:RWD domain-containing protein 4 n=2 Tax=obscura subgroup TaxID=32357 RepID=A0A3B0JBJ5_DROGU|nr:RWD domain-containing protein 4 [Drosophila guanche]XP_034666866.1 RWD domain-containing protein 4 [Drosophila subobscura]SPP79405.1 blast:RWD domain-containing protein 4 [Drosophila guanche]